MSIGVSELLRDSVYSSAGELRGSLRSVLVVKSGFPYTLTLAEWALGNDPAHAPGAVKHETSRILLDILGCAVAGQVTPSGRIVVDLASAEHGPLEATVIGAGKASLLPAVYANSMLANALDLDVWGPEGHMA